MTAVKYSNKWKPGQTAWMAQSFWRYPNGFMRPASDVDPGGPVETVYVAKSLTLQRRRRSYYGQRMQWPAWNAIEFDGTRSMVDERELHKTQLEAERRAALLTLERGV